VMDLGVVHPSHTTTPGIPPNSVYLDPLLLRRPLINTDDKDICLLILQNRRLRLLYLLGYAIYGCINNTYTAVLSTTNQPYMQGPVIS
jgi:hypothetical protein